MRSVAFYLVVFISGIFIFGVFGDFPQLHRALPGANGKPGYRVTSSTRAVDSNQQDKHGSATDKDIGSKSHHSTMDFESGRSTAVVYSIISSILVGLSGIFPLLVIPLEAGPSLKHGAGSAMLKLLLSFAVGSLLGDVFLHLLPESWATVNSAPDPHWAHTVIGLWVVCGLLSFMVIEKVFMEEENDEDEEDEEEVKEETKQCNGSSLHDNKVTENGHSNGFIKENGHTNGLILRKVNGTGNGHIKNDENENTESKKIDKSSEKSGDKIQISGYLNLLANCIDNFTHGLAVAGSYLISPKVGLCTTIAILLHEIPHEVGDFAILLRSGFDRWKAAKAQVLTASGGVLGALFALYSDSAESAGDRTAAILPFTAGGFLYIALVTVVPDLLKEKSPLESLKQVVCIISGVLAMMAVTLLFE